MINKKIILAATLTVFLNGCVQNTAILGPVYTYSTSGSVFQTGLSYSSNKIYTKYKEEKNDNDLQKIMKNDKRNQELKNLIERQITKTRKKLKIIN